jgi:peroxiredoxin Q/BCP
MKKYEVMTEQAVNGATRPCVHRSTFVIDKKGVLRHILRDLNPREHASAVLKLVRQIHGH